MKVIIIGASGLVGSNILKEFKSHSIEAVGTHLTYETKQTVFYDTLQPNHPNNFDIIAYQPDVMIHCGALTHVDYCETHEDESFEKTVQSTINLLAIAKELQSKFVYISTDYVFDGKNGPYDETAIPNPINIYGTHKHEAERNVVHSKLNYLIIRVAKVFGPEERNKNFVARLAKTIEDTNQLQWKAFTDQYTTAIHAYDIAKAIRKLLVDDKTGIYHLGYGRYFNVYQMVQMIGNFYANAEVTIEPITTAEFKQTAKRPAKGGLKNEKFLEEYPEFKFSTIENYLFERKQSKA